MEADEFEKAMVEAAYHLGCIERLFGKESRVTVVITFGDDPDSDIVFASDHDKAIAALQRAKGTPPADRIMLRPAP